MEKSSCKNYDKSKYDDFIMEDDYVEVFDGEQWKKDCYVSKNGYSVGCIYKYIQLLKVFSPDEDEVVYFKVLIAVVDDVQESVFDYIIVDEDCVRKEKECE